MTHEAFFLPYAMALVSVLFGLLVVMVGWVGTQINIRLDKLTMAVSDITKELVNIELRMKDELHDIDGRVRQIEAICQIQHGVNLQQGN